jgi:hypothetical protein
MVEDALAEVGKINSIVPDNTRFSINMHYQSDSTREFATFRINKAMTVEDVLSLYARLCPIECHAFLQEVQLANKSLHRPGGMSSAGIIMALGKVPSIVLMMLEFLDPDFFTGSERIKNFRRFIRAYPKFSIGDHKQGKARGVIIK